MTRVGALHTVKGKGEIRFRPTCKYGLHVHVRARDDAWLNVFPCQMVTYRLNVT